MPARRCFVISPIGEPGSDVRDHVDDLLRYVITPAMDELGIVAHRSDHDAQVGRISDHMFRSILTDDLCIAVLTYHNPNVFYELAVAQSAARPVLIMAQKGTALPFDVKDMRVIEYDFRPRSVIEGVYVRQIVDMVRNLEAEGWKVGVPFAPHLAPLGGSSGPVRWYDRVESFGPSDAWLALLKEAVNAIDLSGITLRYWSKIPHFQRLIREKAAVGCRVRVLLMHPDNPTLLQYMNPKVKLKPATAAAECEASFSFFGQMAADCESVEVRRIRAGAHHQQVVRADGRMLASLVMFSEATNRSPLFECTEASPVYRQLLDEFEALWHANSEDGKTTPNEPTKP